MSDLSNPMVAAQERVDAQIAEIEAKIAHARQQTEHWQHRRRALTDERYALVKAREFITAGDWTALAEHAERQA